MKKSAATSAVVILFSALWMIVTADHAQAKRLYVPPPNLTGLKMQADGWKACISWCDSKYSFLKKQQACHVQCDRYWGPH